MMNLEICDGKGGFKTEFEEEGGARNVRRMHAIHGGLSHGIGEEALEHCRYLGSAVLPGGFDFTYA
jgi:hypothetical protein